jgi:3-hydroxyisobutyrate dehydrogenase-like beta-hydroxyacid dehydrogenase
MKPVVAVIAAGGMGSAVGARLAENGVSVLTSLKGRSEASIARATKAGMKDASEAEIASADILLSIVPPAEAAPLADKLAPALRASNRKPVYVDCNAVNPQSARRVADIVEATGTPFVDGGIIGGPPRAGYNGPVFYVSGADAARVETLNDYGLIVRRIDGAFGAASALKMSYAGITKGLTALGSAMALAASRAGVADALHAELAASQPALLAYLTRAVPDMFGKAYRWVAELDEIAGFAGKEAEAQMYGGIADLYERLADEVERDGEEIAMLRDTFAKPAKPA